MKKLKDLFNLNNKTAIITGGLGHLGLAMTETLLELEADVIISGTGEKIKRVESSQKIEILRQKFPKRTIHFKILNFHDDKSIKIFFQEAEGMANSIDILINNAMYSVSKPVEKMKFSEFNNGINGTLSSVFKCCQSVFPLMKKKKKKGGIIINIASMYGIISPDWRIYRNNSFNNPINYGVAKAGVIQLTKYLATYWARYGIRVNSISPGPFPQKKIIQNKQFHKLLKEKTVLNMVGIPENLKGITALLASEASSYITGQNFVIDGGWTIW